MPDERDSPSDSTILTTSETGLAAFLLSLHVKITATSFHDGRCFWTFEAPSIESLKIAFFNDASVGCQRFLGNYRSLTAIARRGRP